MVAVGLQETGKALMCLKYPIYLGGGKCYTRTLMDRIFHFRYNHKIPAILKNSLLPKTSKNSLPTSNFKRTVTLLNL